MDFLYLLALGSNLGERRENVETGLARLERLGRVLRCSSLVATAPLQSSEHDVSDHGEYLNCVCELVSGWSPRELYERVRTIEDQVGHQRHRKWLPRELDIDLLFCVIDHKGADFSSSQPVIYRGTDGFSVPHAHFWERDFLVEMVTSDLGISREALLRHKFQRSTDGVHEENLQEI